MTEPHPRPAASPRARSRWLDHVRPAHGPGGRPAAGHRQPGRGAAGRLRRQLGTPGRGAAAELHVHDAAAFRRLLLGGATGAGEAYVDGLWSSPDLVTLLSARGAQPALAGALRAAGCARPPRLRSRRRPPAAAQHQGRQPPQHRGPLRPGQRLLPAVAGRDDDLLQRGLRHARPVPRGRPAQQVPADGGGRGPRARHAGAGDRLRLGRLRAVRRRRAGLRRHDHHRLPGAARARHGAHPRRRASRTGSAWSCATTATFTGTYDAIVSIEMLEAVGPEFYPTFFDAVRPGARRRAAG